MQTAPVRGPAEQENRMTELEDPQDTEWSSRTDLHFPESERGRDSPTSADRQSMDTPITVEDNLSSAPYRLGDEDETSSASETDYQSRTKTQKHKVKKKSRSSWFQRIYLSGLGGSVLWPFTLCLNPSHLHTGEANAETDYNRIKQPG
ncbi:hypothetical protein AMEX_G24508 [Astyanax mexicanus]|uniref:Uncharacterized protein n=1 Tax=Astyanax mexicanus TaxID=7994 RepID=A0A8T2L076_ASTMX|nr:hypothetical protein AMEX_G24508 [Astyanax mexicanus]